MKLIRLLRGIVPLTLLAAMPAVADEGGYTPVNLATVDAFIVPAYRALAASTAGLDDTARTFCAAPTDAGLDALRDAYHRQVDAWQAVQHVSIGPVSFEMRRYRMQLWPDKRGNVGKHLGRLLAEGDAAMLDADDFARGSVAVQGISALEQLLFEDAPTAADFAGERRMRCQVAMAVTANMAMITRRIVDDWTAGDAPFRDYVASARLGNAFFEDDETLAALLLRDLRMQLQLIVEYKLTRPLGESADTVRPRRAESWRSGRSLRNVRVNLEALRAQWQAGFATVIDDDTLLGGVEADFDAALAALADLQRPLVDLLDDADARQRVTLLVAATQALVGRFLGDIPGHLDLAAGMVSLDGD